MKKFNFKAKTIIETLWLKSFENQKLLKLKDILLSKMTILEIKTVLL